MATYTKSKSLMDNYKQKSVKPVPRARSKVISNQVTTTIKPSTKPQRIKVKPTLKPVPPVHKGEESPRYKPVLSDTKEEFKIQRIPKQPKEETKKKHKQHKATGRIVEPIWSEKLKKFVKRDIARQHHFTFVQERNGYKIYYKFYLVHGDETYKNDYGQYYTFSPDKAGTVYKSHIYFKQIPSLVGKKYKYKRIGIKEAKKLGLYQEDVYLTVPVALKQMNVFGVANCISLRYNTKYV